MSLPLEDNNDSNNDPLNQPEIINNPDGLMSEMNTNFQTNRNEGFLSWLYEEDEVPEVDNTEKILNQSFSRRLEQEYKANLEKNPKGLKATRFINSNFLLDAPANFFEQYDQIVKETTSKVRNAIADRGQSGVIREAENNPTDLEKQDAAFQIVRSFTNEYLETTAYHRIDKSVIIQLVVDEIIGFSKLDPLWQDSSIDEIICNGPFDIQIERGGILVRVPSCKFRDLAHMNELVERLYGSLGKRVSITTPIVDGRLHDNSRLAIVHESVAQGGPNFTIRRHKEDYISPQQMIDWGAASPELMTFLGNLIYKGCSILVIGSTSSGKTTLLGALTGFLRPDHRILTLEDSLELKLAPNKMNAAPMECQEARADQVGSGVSMRDLVKAALRQRPDIIIVGETRDESAWDLCQALNTGHYGMSTLHANNPRDTIYRLQSLVGQGGIASGDAVLPLIAASFDVIVQVEKFPTDGSRKIVNVSEVHPYPKKNDSGELELPLTTLWKFINDDTNNLHVSGHWEQLNEIGPERREFRRLDLEPDLSWEELKKLASVPNND